MQDHTIRSFPQRDLHLSAVDLQSLWELSPEPRIRWYGSLIPEARYKAFLFRRALEQMMDATARHTVFTPGSGVEGIASWRQLEWDSQQIGLPAARLDFLLAPGIYKEARIVKQKLVSHLLRDCREQGVQYLTARLDCSDRSGIHALESCGFELIDGIQTSTRFLNERRRAPIESQFEIRGFEPRDLQQIVEIARTSYIHDRFHADPAISPEIADQVNAEWLRNACTGMADRVIVAADPSGVVAYVTCKLDHKSKFETGVSCGSIVMVATVDRARGKGAATATTNAAIDWFAAQGVQIVEVGTQLSNTGAARVYQKCEFLPVATTITLRVLIDANHF